MLIDIGVNEGMDEKDKGLDEKDMGLQLIHMDFGVEEEEHENFGNSRIYIKIFHSYYCNAYFNKFEVCITNGRKWRVL